MRVFVDANILFSASNKASNLYRLLHILHRRGTIVVSPGVVEETSRNLQRKRPAWMTDFNALLSLVTLVPDEPLMETVALHAKDRPILGAAIAAKCDYLVTGDKRDFGHLYGEIIGGVEIVDYIMLARRL